MLIDRIRIFDKISEHVKVANSADIAVPEGAIIPFTIKIEIKNKRFVTITFFSQLLI